MSWSGDSRIDMQPFALVLDRLSTAERKVWEAQENKVWEAQRRRAEVTLAATKVRCQQELQKMKDQGLEEKANLEKKLWAARFAMRHLQLQNEAAVPVKSDPYM